MEVVFNLESGWVVEAKDGVATMTSPEEATISITVADLTEIVEVLGIAIRTLR